MSVLSKCFLLQAQFGRRWTKIAKLVGSRTVLQVKSYARQYFKHKVRLDLPPAAAKVALGSTGGHRQTLLPSVLSFQTKSEPKAAAPSPGPVPQNPQTTSSLVNAVTNAVRIERLSDDEDEDVDITDDLSDDGEADSKPQAVVKTEVFEAEQLTGTEVQASGPRDEQREGGRNGKKDHRSHISLPPAQHPQSLSSLPCSEECGVPELDKKSHQMDECVLKKLQAGAGTDSKRMTDTNEGLCSPSESSAETGDLIEACSQSTGTNHTLNVNRT